MLATPAAAATLTASWDAGDTTTVGYVIWYGTVTGSYTQRIDVGARNSFAVTSLSNATRYYFAVQAYNAAGQVSPMSTEVSGVTPAVGGPPQWRRCSDRWRPCGTPPPGTTRPLPQPAPQTSAPFQSNPAPTAPTNFAAMLRDSRWKSVV